MFRTVTFRCHGELLSRLDALTAYVVTQAALAPKGSVRRSDMLRLALEAGIASFEHSATRSERSR
jgi:hypothetical protein